LLDTSYYLLRCAINDITNILQTLWPLCVQSRNTVSLFASNVPTFLAKEINTTQFILRDLFLVMSVLQALTHVDLVKIWKEAVVT